MTDRIITPRPGPVITESEVARLKAEARARGAEIWVEATVVPDGPADPEAGSALGVIDRIAAALVPRPEPEAGQ